MTGRPRARRWLRWAVVLLVLAGLWFGILRRFSVRRLDIATVEAMAPSLKRGALHLVDADPPRILGRGWVVWWRWQEGTVFSRVVAQPGEVVVHTGKRWAVRGDGERLLRPEVQLSDEWRDRALGPGEYLLLNDRLRAAWPDSRAVGPVSRGDVVARVLFPF